MKFLIKFAVIFLLVNVSISLLAELPSAASSPSQIRVVNAKGIILDRDGKRLRGATVTFENGVIKRQFKSNRVGELAIDLPSGVYAVSVKKYGSKIAIHRVEVKETLILTITFPFKPARNQTYSQSMRLTGKVRGRIIASTCEPMPPTRINMKNRMWQQVIVSAQDGYFIADVPDGEYSISIFTGGQPGNISWENGQLYLYVDVGQECIREFFGTREIFTDAPLIIETEILERKPVPVP